MTTGTIILSMLGAVLPDNSTGNKAPTYQRVKSSASAPTPHFVQLIYDPTTTQIAHWAFRMPADYSSGMVAKIQHKTLATDNAMSIIFNVYVAAITPTDAETPNEKAFGTVNTVTTHPNATEARRLIEGSCTLTNADSVAAGDWVVIGLERDTGDTCSSDVEVIGLAIEYTGA